MLNSLHVRNLALIEEAEVEFGSGLNILTGETGAGKSIIIGSINLALGAKADRDMIRTGAAWALIELVFTLDGEGQRERCRELGIEVEDDLLVISRKLTAGRSLCRINGETRSARQVGELAEVLLDVYGQHEHQSLTTRKKQSEILDDFCGQELLGIKEKLAGEYRRYAALRDEWEALENDGRERERECSLLAFELEEIDKAALSVGEDERLEADYRKMANARKIMEGISLSCSLLDDVEQESICGMAGRAVRELKGLVQYDEALEAFVEKLSVIEDMAQDVHRDLSDYEEELEFEPDVFLETEARLDLINRLKAKYGGTIEEILAYQARQAQRLEKLQNYDLYVEKLKTDLGQAREKALSLCGKLSRVRKKQARLLAERMAQALRDLNFMDVQFEISVEAAGEEPGPSGFDQVEFLLSTNPGEPLKPLAAIASGGELSRIMLGLKTVMAQRGDIPTLIFDEIDAGISGRTAWQVSKKLAVLGKSHQVICITHLPQIASMADVHFKIEKKQEKHDTKTNISILGEDESIRELARLLGSDTLTDAAISNAKEMKELAADTKQY